ncbi:Eukaryotic translation initiation factor 3 subunit E [Zea mays]|uniref:Eukaryotic translation initiation factor 3 subunit E n=1 Tax=Zea mays TaxID=4577 RepID=A0A1D6Q4Y5_MAIZE|nr:Eukaryotic translation initiation factor 3 subunit E [Zea mays]
MIILASVISSTVSNVGMAATLASVCSVPLTSVLLLFELTKDYRILLPLMIGLDQIEALYQYAQFQFECGNYSGAADYLYQYGALCTNSERNVSALWGKLAAEILMQNWDLALEELNRLKEIIDSKLQNRIWLMHWALFIFFNHIRYLNAIQTNAHHLIRPIKFIILNTPKCNFAFSYNLFQVELTM